MNHFMFRDAKQLLSGQRNLFLRRKHMSHAEYIKHLTKKKSEVSKIMFRNLTHYK